MGEKIDNLVVKLAWDLPQHVGSGHVQAHISRSPGGGTHIVHEYDRIHAEAHAAGMKAGEEAVPVPMHVVQRSNPFDDSSPITKRYAPVMDGVCGFASVHMAGTHPYAKHLLKNVPGAHKGYPKGVDLSVHAFGQSMTRKAAYASAYSGVLKTHGIDSYPTSRMD